LGFYIVMATTSAAAVKPGKSRGAKTSPGISRPYFRVGPQQQEIEPNNDCEHASGPIGSGEAYEGVITSGDEDWYAFEVVTGGTLAVFETHAISGQQSLDSKLFLFSRSCLTQLEVNDDGGWGLYSRFNYYFTTPGVYFLVVAGYDQWEAGSYLLTANELSLAEHNDCSGAIDLVAQHQQEFDLNTCTGLDEYWQTNDPGCLDWEMHGPDLVYRIYLDDGHLEVTMEAAWDGGMYLVTDCADVAGSCVAVADEAMAGDPETLAYTAGEPGWYYLIIDAEEECGEAHVIINSPLASESQSWGAVKTLYR
jgi:hypothetical protein